jgi:uncharacterized membrane protein YdbT with pleckstrin-like domain
VTEVAGYIETTLSKGEIVLLQTKISLLPYILRFIAGAFFVVAAIGATAASEGAVLILAGIAALLIAPPLLRYFTNELALTNKRVVARFGILSLSTLEIRLEKIESVSVQQNLFGRMLGYGSVIVRGTGGSQDPMPNIPNPVDFRTRFASALENDHVPVNVSPPKTNNPCSNCNTTNAASSRFCSNCGTVLTGTAA